MSFKEINSLDAEVTIALGGINKQTKKANPTSVEGYFLGTRRVENKLGECSIHFFQTSKGNVGVWGKTDLDRKLKNVALGSMTRATSIGTVPTPRGKDMYKFKVEVDEANTIEVDNSSSEEAPESSGLEGYEDEGYGSESLDSDDSEVSLDEVLASRPSAPSRPAATPDAARQAKVRELLNKGRSKNT